MFAADVCLLFCIVACCRLSFVVVGLLFSVGARCWLFVAYRALFVAVCCVRLLFLLFVVCSLFVCVR